MESRRGRTFHGFGNEIMSAKIGAFIVVAGLFVASTGAARGAGEYRSNREETAGQYSRSPAVALRGLHRTKGQQGVLLFTQRAMR